MNPENGLSETLYFPDQALKNMMRDAVVFFYYDARSAQNHIWPSIYRS